jgi:hypothetical protein
MPRDLINALSLICGSMDVEGPAGRFAAANAINSRLNGFPRRRRPMIWSPSRSFFRFGRRLFHRPASQSGCAKPGRLCDPGRGFTVNYGARCFRGSLVLGISFRLEQTCFRHLLPLSPKNEKGRAVPTFSKASRADASTSVVKGYGRIISGGLEILCGAFAVAGILDDLEVHFLALDERTQSSALHGGNVDEHVRLPVALLDEAKALGRIEKLHCSGSHTISFQIDANYLRQTKCQASQFRN